MNTADKLKELDALAEKYFSMPIEALPSPARQMLLDAWLMGYNAASQVAQRAAVKAVANITETLTPCNPKTDN